MKKNNLILKKNINSKLLKKSLSKRLNKKFNKIFLETKNDVRNIKKTLNVLDKNFKFNFKTNNLKKFKKFRTIALIGMGGSMLGSEAIYQFLEKKIKKKIYFFNDLDENKLINFKKKENTSKVLFIIISKSGNTVETISNSFLLNIIKKNAKNIILISEKKNTLLFSLSKKFNLFFIEHKKNIGGRYSVLSEVGIVPAYLFGIDVYDLRAEILEIFKKTNKSFLKSVVIEVTNLMNSKKIKNLILLNYCPELEKFLYWCQQLIAESLGKKNKGFLPVISNAPKDHHSLLQLFLDGPKDKVFYIFSYEKKSRERINVKKNIDIDRFLNKKNLSTIKNAQKNALIKSFIEKDIPLREFRFSEINERVLGKLFSLFIIETVLIGKLSNINPFDQPAVEEVKISTKKLLK